MTAAATAGRTRNKRGIFTSAERAKMFSADQREKLRALRASLKAARLSKARALKLISASCKAKREDITTRCRLDRKQARAQGFKVMAEREAKLREEREAQAQMKHWTRKERQQRVTAKERKTESAEEVARNIDPEFLPVWHKVKAKIRKGDYSSRTEAFEQWLHDHPSDVLEIVADAAEDVSDWLAEEQEHYAVANPPKKAAKKKKPALELRGDPKRTTPVKPAPNARHATPDKAVFLGEPLDLWVRYRNQITHYDKGDLKGMVMLTTPGAEELAPGRVRLFLALPRKIKTSNKSFGAGAATFRSWHQRNPEGVVDFMGLPDTYGHRLGRAVKLDYRSDKWGGRWTDYTHSFEDGAPPLVYADKKSKPRGFCLVGGDMTITEHGIE